MTGGSLGLRSGSYGSLQQQLQNGVFPIPTTTTTTTTTTTLPRKTSKMLKEKEKLLHWILKFAGRKKVGMLFLSVVSAAVFVWVLYMGKGEEDAQEGDSIQNIKDNDSLALSYLGPPPIYIEPNSNKENNSSLSNLVRSENIVQPPPPPAYFLGYKLPPGNPCETFTLPPPPADKKRTGPRPCPVCYLPIEEAIALMPKGPSPSPILSNLTFVVEENPTRSDDSLAGSDFGGYPSLMQRNDSHNIRESMTVHCGFVRGKPGQQTGYDIDEADLLDMEQCPGVVVASAIFGAYDLINQPQNISEAAKENVCFYMFVDEETEAFLKNSRGLDGSKRIGLWRIIVVYNLPYTDPRRTGKVPKLLMHRLFPNARYSIWIDGKLQLVVDPYQILERFLWRKNVSFAISRHYKRFDVFTEAEANKAAGKYDNASIDFQVEFYKREGLTPYSEAKLPITSDVPEGCVIIREHIPISNLFTCLWFNEVDRFTSRDQISFSTARDKIMSKVNWSINMFLDCERRNFVVQGYHRDVLEHWAPPPPTLAIDVYPPPFAVDVHPPPALVNELPAKSPPTILLERVESTPIRKIPARRGRRRHRKAAAGNRDTNSI